MQKVADINILAKRSEVESSRYLLGHKDTCGGWEYSLGINTVDLVTAAQVGSAGAELDSKRLSSVVQALQVGNSDGANTTNHVVLSLGSNEDIAGIVAGDDRAGDRVGGGAVALGTTVLDGSSWDVALLRRTSDRLEVEAGT